MHIIRANRYGIGLIVAKYGAPLNYYLWSCNEHGRSCWLIIFFLIFLKMDEEAQMWCSWSVWGCIQIQRQETAICPHRTEVAAQAYHVQVGGLLRFLHAFVGIKKQKFPNCSSYILRYAIMYFSCFFYINHKYNNYKKCFCCHIYQCWFNHVRSQFVMITLFMINYSWFITATLWLIVFEFFLLFLKLH